MQRVLNNPRHFILSKEASYREMVEVGYANLYSNAIYAHHHYMSRLMTKRSECAPSEDSDQPRHPPSLIRVRCPYEESLGL